MVKCPLSFTRKVSLDNIDVAAAHQIPSDNKTRANKICVFRLEGSDIILGFLALELSKKMQKNKSNYFI